MKNSIICFLLYLTISSGSAQQPLPSFSVQFDSNSPTYASGSGSTCDADDICLRVTVPEGATSVIVAGAAWSWSGIALANTAGNVWSATLDDIQKDTDFSTGSNQYVISYDLDGTTYNEGAVNGANSLLRTEIDAGNCVNEIASGRIDDTVGQEGRTFVEGVNLYEFEAGKCLVNDDPGAVSGGASGRLLQLFECEHYARSQGVDVPGNHWQHKETFDSSLPVGCSVDGYVNGLSPNDPTALIFFYNTPPASVASDTGACCEGACGSADACIVTLSPVISKFDDFIIDPEAANTLSEDYWSGKSTDCLVQGTEAQPKYALLKHGVLSCALCGRAEFFAEYSRDNYFLDVSQLPSIQQVARHSPCCVNSHHKVCQRMLEEYKLRCDMHDKGAGGTCTADINVVHVTNSDITGNPETATKTQCETYAQNSGLDEDDFLETVNTDTIPRGCVYVHEVDGTKEVKYNDKSNSMMQCSTTNECLTWAFDRTLA